MWLLLVPLVILFALLLAAGLLVAGVASFIGFAWPWLLIALGIWMFAHQDGRHRRARRWGAQPIDAGAQPVPARDWPHHGRRHGRHAAPPPSDVPAAAPAASRAPAASAASAPSGPSKRRLPADVELKAEQIRRKATALAEQSDQFPPFSQDLYLVRQTTSDYLPRTLETFLGLPWDSIDKPMVDGGKTPHQELKAQLDLLDAKLDDIVRDLDRQTSDRLKANRRFLEDRFDLRNPKDDSALHPKDESTLRAESA